MLESMFRCASTFMDLCHLNWWVHFPLCLPGWTRPLRRCISNILTAKCPLCPEFLSSTLPHHSIHLEDASVSRVYDPFDSVLLVECARPPVHMHGDGCCDPYKVRQADFDATHVSLMQKEHTGPSLMKVLPGCRSSCFAQSIPS